MPLQAQVKVDADAIPRPYFIVDETKLIETKWRYTYALHVESNTIIHQAQDEYNFFLYFRYDYTYQQYLNDSFSQGTWSLNENELFYKFKHINKFVIAEINKETLVLEFNQPNSKGTYQYHYVRINDKDAPFLKPINELPLVNVEAANPRRSKKRWWAAKDVEKVKKEEASYISIDLIGGGYYGGIDPVVRDYIQIKNTGRLIKEFKSLNQGLLITKKNIPREELEQFAAYIVQQGFFEFDRVYDCNNTICSKRKRQKPTPIPLRIAIAYGNRKKVITISIWGKDENNINYVDYPPALDNIIDSIQRMAHRLDDNTYGLKK